MKKYAIFAFQGELVCFSHGLLNALDLDQKGYEVQLVIEGAAVKLIGVLNSSENPFHELYRKVIDNKLLAGVCQACANKMGTLDEAKAQGLTLLNDMKGHPSMASFLERGFKIVTI